MSTGCECLLVEQEPGKWFYVLEDYSAPKNAWDWREFATAYGFFTSEDETLKHLRDNHANPGGWNVVRANEYKPDAVIDKLLTEMKARNPYYRASKGW